MHAEQRPHSHTSGTIDASWGLCGGCKLQHLFWVSLSLTQKRAPCMCWQYVRWCEHCTHQRCCCSPNQIARSTSRRHTGNRPHHSMVSLLGPSAPGGLVGGVARSSGALPRAASVRVPRCRVPPTPTFGGCLGAVGRPGRLVTARVAEATAAPGTADGISITVDDSSDPKFTVISVKVRARAV
jgi:hypothetical protein